MHLLAPKLLYCAQHDAVSRLKVLLEEERQKSRDPSSQWLCGVCYDKSGDTLAHVACRHGSVNILRFLVEEIGSTSFLEAPNLDGKRPLHEAAQNSQLESVRFLVENGCQVDPLKRADWTPLMLACTKHDLQVVKLLIEKGANLKLRNKDGWTPFHIACREGHASIVGYLLDTCAEAFDCCSNNKRTPLHTAALQGRLECVNILLERGNYPPDVRDNCRSTPFMDAAQADQTDIMERLATHKADVGAVDVLGRNSLHLAAQAGAVGAVRLLVDRYGLDPNSTDMWGQTALHYAAKHKCEQSWRCKHGHAVLDDDPFTSGVHMRTRLVQYIAFALSTPPLLALVMKLYTHDSCFILGEARPQSRHRTLADLWSPPRTKRQQGAYRM